VALEPRSDLRTEARRERRGRVQIEGVAVISAGLQQGGRRGRLKRDVSSVFTPWAIARQWASFVLGERQPARGKTSRATAESVSHQLPSSSRSAVTPCCAVLYGLDANLSELHGSCVKRRLLGEAESNPLAPTNLSDLSRKTVQTRGDGGPVAPQPVAQLPLELSDGRLQVITGGMSVPLGHLELRVPS
jgi:hypothetical protein